MERDGQIVQTSAQKYIAISRLKRVEGTYHRRRDGSACLLYQGDQIHISGFSTQIAMEGDNVEAALYNGIHNVDKALITAIKSRKNRSWIAQVVSVYDDYCVAQLFLLNQEQKVNFKTQTKMAVGDFVKLSLTSKSNANVGQLTLNLETHLGRWLPPQHGRNDCRSVGYPAPNVT